MSINRRKDKQIWDIHTEHNYPAMKKNQLPNDNFKNFQTVIHNNMDEFQKHFIEQRKTDIKEHTLYDFISMNFERQN